MFAIAIELLAGRYVASAYNDRERTEWPPHPARLFSALVAAWAEAGGPEAGREAERTALTWLEQQAPPVILATTREAAGIRNVVAVYVPVNDVGVINAPSRDRLEDAERALAAAVDSKAAKKAEAALAKIRTKYEADMLRALAVPAKIGKGEPTAADRLVSDRRTRQPRTFPCATPEVPHVAFVWPDAEVSEPIAPLLSSLLSRLVRLGHSSSLVRASVATAAEIDRISARTSRYEPDDEEGDQVIRWVASGQVDGLVRAYDLHREVDPRVLPARFVRYRQGARGSTPRAVHSVFSDDVIVFARVGGPRLPITAIAGIARQMRRALQSYADQPVPAIISGHEPLGGPSQQPHLAVVPLPFVAAPHADGSVLGVALVLPRSLDPATRLEVMRAVGRFEEAGRSDDDAQAPVISLILGEAATLELQRVVWGSHPTATLRPWTWCRPARRWASATPVALDRNPGDLAHADADRRQAAFREATQTLIAGIGHIGLPAPVEVDVVRSCVLPGTAKPRSYPRFPADATRTQRVLVHARLTFAEPIRGPIVVGAGRYQGLGLFRPVDAEGETR